LRERLDDIPLLCNSFLKNFSAANKKDIKGISAEAIGILKSYNWPGNVRELQNVIERAVSLSDGGMITHKDLPDSMKTVSHQPSAISHKFKDAKKECLSSFEKDYLLELLEKNDNNITKAAEEAGIPRMTIYRMMKKYNLKGD
jgi:transcriptional regulator with PAS, ATPase and Fis domain